MRNRVVTVVVAAAAASLLGSPALAAGTSAPAPSAGRVVVTGPHVPAGSIAYRLGRQYCASYEAFTATLYEYGTSGTTRFAQRAQVQKYTTAGWVRDSSVFTYYSNSFPNNASSHYYSLRWVHHYTPGDRGATVRWVWQGFWLNGTRVIANTKLLQAVACNVG